MSCCFSIFLILFKAVTIDWKGSGHSIFSHLPRRRSPRPGSIAGNGPASPSHQRLENLQLLPVQVVKLLGQVVEGGFVVFHVLLERQIEEVSWLVVGLSQRAGIARSSLLPGAPPSAPTSPSHHPHHSGQLLPFLPFYKKETETWRG